MPTDARGPACRRGDAAKRRNQRRLARAIRAKQGKDLALFDPERHAPERLEPAVIRFLQALDLDYGCHGAPPFPDPKLGVSWPSAIRRRRRLLCAPLQNDKTPVRLTVH